MSKLTTAESLTLMESSDVHITITRGYEGEGSFTKVAATAMKIVCSSEIKSQFGLMFLITIYKKFDLRKISSLSP